MLVGRRKPVRRSNQYRFVLDDQSFCDRHHAPSRLQYRRVAALLSLLALVKHRRRAPRLWHDAMDCAPLGDGLEHPPSRLPGTSLLLGKTRWFMLSWRINREGRPRTSASGTTSNGVRMAREGGVDGRS
jgi:hypothetical protein